MSEQTESIFGKVEGLIDKGMKPYNDVAVNLEGMLPGKKTYQYYAEDAPGANAGFFARVKGFINGPILRNISNFVSGSQTGLAEHMGRLAVFILGGAGVGTLIGALTKKCFEAAGYEVNDNKNDPGNQWRVIATHAPKIIALGVAGWLGSRTYVTQRLDVKGAEAVPDDKADIFHLTEKTWRQYGESAAVYSAATATQGISSGLARLVNGLFIGIRFIFSAKQTVKWDGLNKIFSDVEDCYGVGPDGVRQFLANHISESPMVDHREIVSACTAMLVRTFDKTKVTKATVLTMAAKIVGVINQVNEDDSPKYEVENDKKGNPTSYTKESKAALKKDVLNAISGNNLHELLFGEAVRSNSLNELPLDFEENRGSAKNYLTKLSKENLGGIGFMPEDLKMDPGGLFGGIAKAFAKTAPKAQEKINEYKHMGEAIAISSLPANLRGLSRESHGLKNPGPMRYATS